MNAYPGLETNVLVSLVHENIGKVAIEREKLENLQLFHNTGRRKKQKVISVRVGAGKMPINFLIPPLYILPKEAPKNFKSNIRFTTPELVRHSKLARIEYGLLMTEAQVSEESVGHHERVQILHKQIVGFVASLLRLLCQLVRPEENIVIGGLENSLKYLRESQMNRIIELEPAIKKLKEMEKSAFRFSNNYITPAHLNGAIKTCWTLFEILESNVILREYEPLKRKKNLLFA